MFEFLYILCVGILSIFMELIFRSFGIPVPVLFLTVLCMAMLMNTLWTFPTTLIFGIALDLLQGNSLPLSFPLMALAALPFALSRENHPLRSTFSLIPIGFLLPFLMALPHTAAIFRDNDFLSALIISGIACMILFPLCFSLHHTLMRLLKIGVFSDNSATEDT